MSDTPKRDQLWVEQTNSEDVHSFLAEALTKKELGDVPVCFLFRKMPGIVMLKWRPLDSTLDEKVKVYHQIVVPTVYRNEILSIA